MADGIERFRRFLCELTKLCDSAVGEDAIREHGGAALRDLVAADDWLPAEFCEPDPVQYRQRHMPLCPVTQLVVAVCARA